jgi:hypothetical protein
MFHVQLHLVSGQTINADLDPRLLIQQPTRDELEDRADRLRLVAVAMGEMPAEEGTLNFLAQHAPAVVVDRAAIAGIEVIDPDPSTTPRRPARAATAIERELAEGAR